MKKGSGKPKPRINPHPRKRDLVGRRIVGVNFSRTWDGEKWVPDWRITLDNGAVLSTTTVEDSRSHDYGHTLHAFDAFPEWRKPCTDPQHYYDAEHDCIECPTCAKPYLGK